MMNYPCTKEILYILSQELGVDQTSYPEFEEVTTFWAEHYQINGWGCKKSLQFTRERVKNILRVGEKSDAI